MSSRVQVRYCTLIDAQEGPLDRSDLWTAVPDARPARTTGSLLVVSVACWKALSLPSPPVQEPEALSEQGQVSRNDGSAADLIRVYTKKASQA